MYLFLCLLPICPHRVVSPIRAGTLSCSLQYHRCLVNSKESITMLGERRERGKEAGRMELSQPLWSQGKGEGLATAAGLASQQGLP